MPSPIAHSLIGLASGVAALRPRGEPVAETVRRRSAALLGCMALANAPDLDFVPGFIAGDMNAFHHGTSHTLVWAVGFGLWAWLLVRLFQTMQKADFADVFNLANLGAALQEVGVGVGLVILALFWTRRTAPDTTPAIPKSASP